MIIVFLKRLLLMLVLVFLQVLVCNHIHLMGYATPMLYVLFLFSFPYNSSRIANMLWAFTMGLLVDSFSNTLGEAAASLTLTAFIQWPLLHTMAPKDCIEEMVPTYRTMGRWNHVRYIFLLTLIHHVVFYLMESFSFFHLTEMLTSLASSFTLSFVLLLTLDTLRNGK